MDSFIASSLSILCTHPLEVIKVRIQTDQFKKIGYRNLYHGIIPQLCAQPVFYTVFDSSVKKYKDSRLPQNDILKAFTCSTIASLIANPFFVIKTRLQSGNKDTLCRMVKREGYQSLMKGSLSTIVNNTKLSIQFPLYWELEKKYKSVIGSSIVSKTVANTIFYPTELIRTTIRNSSTRLTFKETYKQLYPNLYRGFIAYNMFSIPNFVLFMWFKKLLFQ